MVSGDYVDVVKTDGPGGDLLVLVGDVSGKGVAAALLMSHLHAAFRSMAANGTTLVEMVGQVNRLLCAATASNTFATLASTSADGPASLVAALIAAESAHRGAAVPHDDLTVMALARE